LAVNGTDPTFVGGKFGVPKVSLHEPENRVTCHFREDKKACCPAAKPADSESKAEEETNPRATMPGARPNNAARA